MPTIQLSEINKAIANFATDGFDSQEQEYYDLHLPRYADTVSLLPAPQPQAKLLDVGIFPGHLAAIAQALGYTIYGISNAIMTEAFRIRAEQHDFDVRCLDIEVDPFPFEDESFDAVLFCETIEHLYRDPFAVLQEIFRVLKPSGTLVITTPNLVNAGKIFRLWQGLWIEHPIWKPLEQTFPHDLSFIHFREYTLAELIYMLCWQRKYQFRFYLKQILHSDCWDLNFREVRKHLKEPSLFAKLIMVWLVIRLMPSKRGCIMLSLQKPRQAISVEPNSCSEWFGFQPVEPHDVKVNTSARLWPTHFRWTGQRSHFCVPNLVPGKGTQIRLRCGRVQKELSPTSLRISVNNVLALEAIVKPTKEYLCLTIPIPANQQRADTFKIELQTETNEQGLGVMLAWEPLLIISANHCGTEDIEAWGKIEPDDD